MLTIMSEAGSTSTNVLHDLVDLAARPDPADGLRAVAALRRLLEQLEALHVGQARDQGWSWQEIADALGLTKQTVHRKHRNPR